LPNSNKKSFGFSTDSIPAFLGQEKKFKIAESFNYKLANLFVQSNQLISFAAVTLLIV